MDILLTSVLLLIVGNAVLAITTAKTAKVAKVKAKADTNSRSLPTIVCRKATASKKQHWATYSNQGIAIYDSSINPLIK